MTLVSDDTGLCFNIAFFVQMLSCCVSYTQYKYTKIKWHLHTYKDIPDKV